MELYQLTVNQDDWRRYQIEGDHTWSLPPLACDVCGARWKTTGEAYPTVDVGDIAWMYPREQQRPLPFEEFERLRSRVRLLAPQDAPLNPGADFGPFVGTAKGTFRDFAWNESWTMFLRRDALLQLSERGVHLPRWGTPRLLTGQRGGPLPDLVEPEAVPLVDLALESLRAPRQPRCARCGRQPGWLEEFLVPAHASLPEGVDLGRARNNPALYVASERFADAVRALALTGCVLNRLRTV